MRMSGPVLDAPDVTGLTRFYERLLGWEVEEIEGPRPGRPPGETREPRADTRTSSGIPFG